MDHHRNSRNDIFQQDLQGSLQILKIKNQIRWYRNDTCNKESNPFFVFSFVEEGDNEELLLNMGRKKDETFFSPYFPDPFVQMDESKEDYLQQVMSAVMMRVERSWLNHEI